MQILFLKSSNKDKLTLTISFIHTPDVLTDFYPVDAV